MATDNNSFEIIQTDDGEVVIHNLQDDTYSILTDPIMKPPAKQSSSTSPALEVSDSDIIQTDEGEVMIRNLQDDTYSIVADQTMELPAKRSGCTSHALEVSDSDCAKINERPNVWSKPHTLFLLEKYKLKRDEFENPRFRKIDLFKDIANMLQSELRTEFTAIQCQNRFKTLFNKYKSIRDHNNTSGKERRDWEYFEQIADIMGDKPSVVPVASCSSLQLATSKQTENETIQQDQTHKYKRRKVEKRATPRGELQKFLQQYKSEQNEKERQRLEVLERHHTENKAVLEKLIEALKD